VNVVLAITSKIYLTLSFGVVHKILQLTFW